MIVLANEVLRAINHVRWRLSRVVDDCHRGHRRRAESDARGIAQVDIESLVPFDVRIIVDEHGKTLGGFTRRKSQRADRRDVIASFGGGDVGDEVVDARRAGSITDAVDRDRDRSAGFDDAVVR